MRTLRIRWLGRVRYAEADDLQRALHGRADDDYLLLLEHPPVYTMGSKADARNVLVPLASLGADLVQTDRGGDVTYHGPGQLVGYPIVSLPEWRNGVRDVVGYVRSLEAVLIEALAELGIEAHREQRYPGVWVGEEKVAAIGVRVASGRTRHGFALNVNPDLTMFDHIVPCGIADRRVTSLARLLGPAPDMRTVVDVVAARFASRFAAVEVERQDVVWRETPSDLSAFTLAAGSDTITPGPGPRDSRPLRLLGRLAEAGVYTKPAPTFERPSWMRVRAHRGPRYRETENVMRTLSLHTVCEEAACPNIFECWAERTATFMILGDRCTRACGFCLVDTRRPLPLDTDEPERVADAVAHLGLVHAVVTSVARDDLPDGGAEGFAATIRAIRARTPATRVEVLVPDCIGQIAAQQVIFDARPDVFNHNLETVARLQRAARPSAAYARSLTLLGRAKDACLLVKSGLIVGLGETVPEVRGAMADLRAVGVDVLTVGQYLRPSRRHMPVARWWHPDEFAELVEYGQGLGFAHVEAGPLVRSSYHARRSAEAAVAIVGGEPEPGLVGT